ncbi:1-acyl-sn-glycerol-3-phosphate acyltransferase beta [Prorops nasuta]|uniref:1-acyl-sn-glycerol-3-phosphate acyltransferase beta n=1 Tax=Prorops nasuta TaxID=863751 RepID=UPI0034CF1D00
MLGLSCCTCGAWLFVPIFLMICAVSDGVRYRMKFVLFIILSAISSSIFIPLMLFKIRHWSNALLPAWCVKNTGKILGVNFVIRGHENIVEDSGCVVLINHQSSIDLCVLGELWSVLKRGTVIAKKEILFFGTFGLAAWLWGTIFIDRSNGPEARGKMNVTSESIKKLKAKVFLFPEGKRHSNKSLMPFKKGAFHVAIAAQTPIQPVVVSRYYFLNDKKKTFDSGTSYITILPPIPTEGLTKEDIPSLIEKAYEIMNNKFIETSQEALNAHMKMLTSQ